MGSGAILHERRVGAASAEEVGLVAGAGPRSIFRFDELRCLSGDVGQKLLEGVSNGSPAERN